MPPHGQMDLVLVGGGHAHALVLRDWAEDPPKSLRPTLIDLQASATYSGMLPGLVAGHYDENDLKADLVALARASGTRFLQDRVDGIDVQNRVLHLRQRGELSFDLLSLDIGAHSTAPTIPGFQEHGLAAKPFGPFLDGWTRWLGQVERDLVPPEIVFVGAGLAGVELALAMHHRIGQSGRSARIRILETGPALGGVAPAGRARLLKALEARGIGVEENCRVEAVASDHVRVAGGPPCPASLVVGTSGARPHDWLAQRGLATEAGFVSVDETLRSVSDPAIFACGDCAHLSHAPRPKAGVFAVRAAPVLSHNLRSAATGGDMRPFHPQSDYLKLVSLGGKTAMAERNGFVLTGGWIWRLKDRIDRGFMRRLQEVPDKAPRSPAG